eukprot:11649906-Alexandrium_andersonii.AAC.1
MSACQSAKIRFATTALRRETSAHRWRGPSRLRELPLDFCPLSVEVAAPSGPTPRQQTNQAERKWPKRKWPKS